MNLWRGSDLPLSSKISREILLVMGIDPERSLQYLSPKIAVQWHETKNGRKTASDVTNKSNKTAWWQCPDFEHHEWESVIGERTRQKNPTSCPFCSSQKLSHENTLAYLFPEIAKEWHPTKNHPLTPEQVFNQSDKKVWWQCSKNPDHEWKAVIGNRSKGSGCPECVGKKPKKD